MMLKVILTLLSTIILNWTDPESDWILFFDIPPNDPYIGTKMIDLVIRNCYLITLKCIRF